MFTKMKNLLIFVLVFLANSVGLSIGANILSISFMASKSHFITYEPLLLELAERGHQVTIANPLPKTKDVENVRWIRTYDKAREGFSSRTYKAKENSNTFLGILNIPYITYFPMVEKACTESYKLENIQKLRNEKFDLVIFAPLWTDCVYGLIHELNTPVILFNQMAIMPWVSSSLGSPALPSFVPMTYFNFPDEMTFFQRVGNFLGMVFINLVRRYYFEPAMEKIYREGLGNPYIPSIREIESNASLALVNSNINFVPPRPLTPDIIEVGGLYLREGKALPKDLQDFCDGAGDPGVILVSFGSILEFSAMPVKTRDIFFNVFSKLKQRVILKWEDDNVPKNLPPNVKLSKWLPQQDILLHSNTRLFITHGGHGSTSESLYAGVPMVGIPIFGEQKWNVEQAVLKGYAVSLEFSDLAEKILADAINTVLYDPEYHRRVDFAAQLYRDQMETPLERAVYWVEYVLRYQGAPHLRSAGRKLSLVEYYSLDVISFLLGIFISILALSWLVVLVILRKVCGSTKSKSNQKKKRF